MSAVTAVCHAGATLYVAPNGSHTYPFATWAAAATNIQLAVNADLDGDILVVSNGVYSGYALFAVNANSWWLWHSATKVRTKTFQLKKRGGWMRMQAAVLDLTAPQDVQWMQQQR